jgi:hypothetical protein
MPCCLFAFFVAATAYGLQLYSLSALGFQLSAVFRLQLAAVFITKKIT